MALIKCPDCQKDVSDKADKCPYCGYPIISLSSNNTLSPASSTSNTSPTLILSSKKIAAIVATTLVIILAVVLGVVIPKQKDASYKQALDLLDRGKYDEGQELLLKIQTIRIRKLF